MLGKPVLKWTIGLALLGVFQPPIDHARAQAPLAGTAPLELDEPLDQWMVAGIDRFATGELQRARRRRHQKWDRRLEDLSAFNGEADSLRRELGEILGVVDSRVTPEGLRLRTTTRQSSKVASNNQVTIDVVSWPVLDGVTAEGLWIRPVGEPVARVVAIADADWTPEMISGVEPADTSFALDLARHGCEVLVPTLINRDHTFSANPKIGRATNQTHREFIYRQAFELGRHIIGYEVQKVLAAVDQLELQNQERALPVAVVGVGEGGLLAFYSGALDKRIDATLVSGYFDQREPMWREPIYRNVWKLLNDFGDAEVSALIAPRRLSVEASPAIVELQGPPPSSRGRHGAAPGVIMRPRRSSVDREFQRAADMWKRLEARDHLRRVGTDGDMPLSTRVIRDWLASITQTKVAVKPQPLTVEVAQKPDVERRQRKQLMELVEFTQRRLGDCHRARHQRFAALDHSDVQAWSGSVGPLRQSILESFIGVLPSTLIPPNPRSRQVIETRDYVGHEVVLDVLPDVVAGGILLMPKDIEAGERRPVVVCQHGLEGTPMSTITDDPADGYLAYKSFAVSLVRRGFIVYAPQNPYRGGDRFRVLQRKSNPLGRSLFSYILSQHRVTLDWLASLPQVDRQRIAFYGLSYGGKTAMRVPPFLAPSDEHAGYCLSICSADFNDWVAKNASYEVPFSYLWTGEYEIFEWNMGHVANYAELAMLMTPRPFMVERGHNDGVGIDEWVAAEFAKVRRHYNQLGIGSRTTIEFFNGPHTINGRGTFEFLHRHLDWPEP